MLKIAIVDDEPSVIDEIQGIVTSFFHENNKPIDISRFSSGEEIISYHQKYDLIFLDIQMQGMDGIMTAQELRKNDKKAVMIYVTSYGGEMARSFSVHPFAFLEKPVSTEMLRKNLQDYMEYAFKEQGSKSIPFETVNGTVLISPDDILYFEYLGNRKIQLVCTAAEYTIQDALSNIFPVVEKYGFMRPHQSFIINPAKINAVHDLDILMVDNKIIPIPIKKKKMVKDMIENYICSRFEEVS